MRKTIDGKIPKNLANDSKTIVVLERKLILMSMTKPDSFLSNPGMGMLVVSLRCQILGFGLIGYYRQTTNILSCQAPFLGKQVKKYRKMICLFSNFGIFQP